MFTISCNIFVKNEEVEIWETQIVVKIRKKEAVYV